MTQADNSYLQRCQQWLAQRSDISIQTLIETIDKFTRQLESLDEDQQLLADDLMATLDILNDALMARENLDSQTSYSPTPDTQVPGSHKIAPTVEAQITTGTEQSNVFDSSSLQRYDGEPATALSEQERQSRLNSLLAQGGVSRGMPVKGKQ